MVDSVRQVYNAQISCLAASALQSKQADIELWRAMLDRLAILMETDGERLKLIRNAEARIEREQIEAFNSWQGVHDDDTCDEAA